MLWLSTNDKAFFGVHPSMLNPRQLEAFHWVMMRGSATAAASAMHVTQPAVSRLIRDFELACGLALFERQGNQLLPTPEATLLLAEVERYAMGLKSVERFAADLKERRRGGLRVCALPAMAMAYLPQLMSRFIEGRALSDVHLHGMPSHLVIEAVAAGQADVGFAAAPIERPGLRIEPLSAHALVALPSNHRLAQRRTLRARDLDGEAMIALAEPSIFASRIDVLIGQVDCRIVASTPLSGIACAMVAAGTGIAIVDPFSVSDYLGRGISAVALSPAIDVRVAVVTPRHRRLSGLVEEFIAAVRRATLEIPGQLPAPGGRRKSS
ncbi:MAG: hypothetical protein RI906_2534 [Pseudomonadota bacterium]|jgi:DNA-binding transcriptional LysR family regulator